MSSGKWRPFCLGLNVLNSWHFGVFCCGMVVIDFTHILPNTFSLWERSFHWKLRCHWLKGLWQGQIAVVLQGTGFRHRHEANLSIAPVPAKKKT